MNKNEFFAKLDELLELPSGTTQPGTALSDIAEWDSVAVISFIALSDSDYGVAVSPMRIAACRTVDDLAALVAA